jgi:uncharacterized membrane protein (DUF2068 family)
MNALWDPTPHPEQLPDHKGLILIAIFKLLKCALLVAVAFGALSLLHSEERDRAIHILNVLRVDVHNHIINAMLERAGILTDRRLEGFSAGSLVYASIFAVEGVGLLRRRKWAEYMTTLVTLSFIPLELYELHRHPGLGEVAALVANLLIVTYLVLRLRQTRYDPSGV